MHILIFLLIVLLLPYLHLSLGLLSMIYVVMLLMMIPDLILAFRGSPPFVPSFQKNMKKMLALADIQKGELVIDPGCGDGRLVFAATKRGAVSIGYEYSFPAWVFTWCRSFFYPRSSIRFADMWTQDYRNADVILCYLLTEKMDDFKKIIWPQLKPGCRVVSNTFTLPGIDYEKRESSVYLYRKNEAKFS